MDGSGLFDRFYVYCSFLIHCTLSCFITCSLFLWMSDVIPAFVDFLIFISACLILLFVVGVIVVLVAHIVSVWGKKTVVATRRDQAQIPF